MCPDGVDTADLMVLCDEWLAESLSLSADIFPDSGDGIVDLLDWVHLAQAWMTSTGWAAWKFYLQGGGPMQIR